MQTLKSQKKKKDSEMLEQYRNKSRENKPNKIKLATPNK